MIFMYGDHLEVRRKAAGVFPYGHHGIEMPGGQICENTWPAGVRFVTSMQFSRGTPVEVLNPGATPAERAAAVDRAAARAGERRYNLLSNNCEHLATWCAYGAAVSHQVIDWLRRLVEWLRTGLAVLAAGLVVGAVASAVAE
jgi:hypothetical protein